MSFPLALVLSAVTGFIALSSELLWYRAWSFACAAQAAAFGALLGFYLVGVAFGSKASRLLCRDRDAASTQALFRPIAYLMLASSVIGFCLIPALALLSTHGDWDQRHAPWLIALPLVAVATTLGGAIFPLISHAGVAADDRAGARVSYIYVSNIIGCAAGSLLTGFVLLEMWSLRAIATAIALVGLVAAVVLLWLSRPGRKALLNSSYFLGATVLLIVAGGPSLYRNVYEKLQMKGLYDPAHPFAHVVENRHGVITVTEDGQVYGGGAYDGVFLVDPIHDRNAIFRVLAMGAMRPNVRNALMIGLASGSWARVVEAFPTLQHLTIIEINPGYLDLIRRFPGGSQLLDSPKVKIVIDDGRRWLHRNPQARFDTIISNTTWHWRSNITNLLSREFLQMVRGHLEPGGLFFYNTTWSDTVEKTAVSVFPYGYRVMNCLAVSDAPIQFDKERWRQFMEPFQLEGHRLFDQQKPDENAALDHLLAMADDLDGPDAREGFETHQHLLQRLADEPILTDDNMLTEW